METATLQHAGDTTSIPFMYKLVQVLTVTLSMYTLIPTVYRALLKSAVSELIIGFIPLRKLVQVLQDDVAGHSCRL